jgi:hypothetical protein
LFGFIGKNYYHSLLNLEVIITYIRITPENYAKQHSGVEAGKVDRFDGL